VNEKCQRKEELIKRNRLRREQRRKDSRFTKLKAVGDFQKYEGRRELHANEKESESSNQPVDSFLR
jgi:hypothetical protein